MRNAVAARHLGNGRGVPGPLVQLERYARDADAQIQFHRTLNRRTLGGADRNGKLRNDARSALGSGEIGNPRRNIGQRRLRFPHIGAPRHEEDRRQRTGRESVHEGPV